MNARVDLRADVAGMSDAEAVDYLLDYFDYLFPKPETVWRLDGVPLAPMEARLLRRLWDGRGMVTRHEHLIGALYGAHPPDNWPDANVLPVYVSRLRPKIAPFGITITPVYQIGYQLDAPRDVTLPLVKV